MPTTLAIIALWGLALYLVDWGLLWLVIAQVYKVMQTHAKNFEEKVQELASRIDKLERPGKTNNNMKG